MSANVKASLDLSTRIRSLRLSQYDDEHGNRLHVTVYAGPKRQDYIGFSFAEIATVRVSEDVMGQSQLWVGAAMFEVSESEVAQLLATWPEIRDERERERADRAAWNAQREARS